MFAVITPTSDEMHMDLGQLVKKRLADRNYMEAATPNVVTDGDEWEAFVITDADLAEGGTVDQVATRKRARGEMQPTIVADVEETDTAE